MTASFFSLASLIFWNINEVKMSWPLRISGKDHLKRGSFSNLREMSSRHQHCAGIGIFSSRILFYL